MRCPLEPVLEQAAREFPGIVLTGPRLGDPGHCVMPDHWLAGSGATWEAGASTGFSPMPGVP